LLLTGGLTSTFENHGTHKAGKKKDSLTEESNPNADILSDTTARLTKPSNLGSRFMTF
jgi:hypothetical protein